MENVVHQWITDKHSSLPGKQSTRGYPIMIISPPPRLRIKIPRLRVKTVSSPTDEGFPMDVHTIAFEHLEDLGIQVWQHTSDEIRCLEEQVLASELSTGLVDK